MTPDSILRIKEAISLPVIAAEYATLRKSGAQWLTLCLWHTDSDPSLRIYEDHYFCFTCQATGDCIDWVAHLEGISKGSALKMLSERTGIPLDGGTSSRAEQSFNKELHQFSLWWQRKRITAMEYQLSAYVIHADARAVEVGEMLRGLREARGSALRVLVERLSTPKEWNDWRAEQEFDRWFAEVWLNIARVWGGVA